MGGGSKQSSSQQSFPGTQSPVTATIQALFGGQPIASGGQFIPTGFGGEGSAFTPQSFAALPGLMQNIPATGAESFLTSPEFQGLATQQGLMSQGLLNQGAGVLSEQLAGPQAAIALARRGFSEETLPAILERAPGFSSSDLQRELTQAGTDLETQIAALREAGQSKALSQVPGFAQAVGTNLLDQASQVLGFGQLGREFMREVGPAGDAFRVLTALQTLTGPALSQLQLGSSKGKSTQVL